MRLPSSALAVTFASVLISNLLDLKEKPLTRINADLRGQSQVRTDHLLSLSAFIRVKNISRFQ
jgi:hypothetical protein